MLRATGLSRSYGAAGALSPTDLHVRAGEAWALVGENGAGKSTLLHLAAGLRHPTAGTVTIDGADARQVAARQGLGFLQEQPALPPRMSPRALLNMIATPAEVQAVVERLDLTPFVDQPAGSLSAGALRRAALATALVHRPALLLLDEPLATLDPVAAARIVDLLVEERERGATLIVATHRLEVLAPAVSHVARLQEGAVVARGPVRDALQGVRLALTALVGAEVALPGDALPACPPLRRVALDAADVDTAVRAVVAGGGTVVHVGPA